MSKFSEFRKRPIPGRQKINKTKKDEMIFPEIQLFLRIPENPYESGIKCYSSGFLMKCFTRAWYGKFPSDAGRK